MGVPDLGRAPSQVSLCFGRGNQPDRQFTIRPCLKDHVLVIPTIPRVCVHSFLSVWQNG